MACQCGNIFTVAYMWRLTALLCLCSNYRNAQGAMDKNTIFAMLFPLGTLENTSDTTWTWTLCAHLDKVKQAGVEFDPEARTLTSVQGIASSGSALQVQCSSLTTVKTCFCLVGAEHVFWTCLIASEARKVTTMQGIASSGSALQVCNTNC